MDTESKQVTEASSNALQEIYDGLSLLPKMPILDVIMPYNQRVEFSQYMGRDDLYPRGS